MNRYYVEDPNIVHPNIEVAGPSGEQVEISVKTTTSEKGVGKNLRQI